MKKISIIVPVYNSEKYLDKCINSILKQTYKNIEIIAIMMARQMEATRNLKVMQREMIE